MLDGYDPLMLLAAAAILFFIAFALAALWEATHR